MKGRTDVTVSYIRRDRKGNPIERKELMGPPHLLADRMEMDNVRFPQPEIVATENQED